MSESKRSAKTLAGEVVSSKMDKTISVRVSRKVKHPLYEKYVRRSTKFMAHDEDNECNEGDLVLIEESRAISKHKSWKLHKIVRQAPKV